MYAGFAHGVEYDTKGTTPVSLIAKSLLANEALLREVGDLLEGCVPGLSVDKIEVTLRTVSQESPLRELFFVGLVVAFQKDLEEEVPALVEKFTGVHVPDQYDTVVTLLVMILLFYGADYAYRRVVVGAAPRKIKHMLDGLIADTSKVTGKPETEIRRVLETKYGQGKIRKLAESAVQFFSPAKREKGAGVIAKPVFVPPDVVEEVPSLAEFDGAAEEVTKEMPDVEIELHAQDMDRRKLGWAGVIREVSEDRLRMQLYPTIPPEKIYRKDRIRGDVIVVSKQQPDGSHKPYLFHLVRLTDDE